MKCRFRFLQSLNQSTYLGLKILSYNFANGYQNLDEAIENIFDEETTSEASSEVVAIPLEPSILTGEEDDIQRNITPVDISGRVEVFVSSHNKECDSSNYEPLQRYRKVDVQTPR